MFKLYGPPEQNTFHFKDYFLLMKLAEGKKRVLEIGPGVSTLAFVEAGVEEIVTLEHDPEWLEKAKERYAEHPQVKVGTYKDEPVVTGSLEPGEQFDLAFVDSPKGFDYEVKDVEGRRIRHPGMEDCSRLNTCLYALEHAPEVILHDAYRCVERGTLGRLHKMGHTHGFVITDNPYANPHSGMAVITRSPTWQKADKI